MPRVIRIITLTLAFASIMTIAFAFNFDDFIHELSDSTNALILADGPAEGDPSIRVVSMLLDTTVNEAMLTLKQQFVRYGDLVLVQDWQRGDRGWTASVARADGSDQLVLMLETAVGNRAGINIAYWKTAP